MFKVFKDEPREVVTQIDIGTDLRGFSNGFEYILINLKKLDNNTYEGELYAISDASDEAHKLYLDTVQELRDAGIQCLTGETLELLDGVFE